MLKSSYSKKIEAGCDEAGRGCLAGPVVAAAVIFPREFKSNLITDSKKLSDKKRREIKIIIEKKAIDWSLGIVSAAEIDKINILNASFLAMHRAIDGLQQSPEMLIIDGNKFGSYKKIPHKCFVKGDSKFLSIAAASILAKTYRDDIMLKIHRDYTEYRWDKNKGYPTKEHQDQIIKVGPCIHHRKSFNLKRRQLKLSL